MPRIFAPSRPLFFNNLADYNLRYDIKRLTSELMEGGVLNSELTRLLSAKQKWAELCVVNAYHLEECTSLYIYIRSQLYIFSSPSR